MGIKTNLNKAGDIIEAKKRAALQRKLDGMDEQYWMAAVDHLSIVDKEFKETYAREKKAFRSYIVTCFEIAEVKYHGYLALLEDGLTIEEEEIIENEYKEKLNSLFQERQNIIGQISSIQAELFDFTKRTFPHESYK